MKKLLLIIAIGIVGCNDTATNVDGSSEMVYKDILVNTNDSCLPIISLLPCDTVYIHDTVFVKVNVKYDNKFGDVKTVNIGRTN